MKSSFSCQRLLVASLFVFGLSGIPGCNQSDTHSMLAESESMGIYIKLSKQALTEDFALRQGFVQDHYQSDNYVTGWVSEELLARVPNGLWTPLDEFEMARRPLNLETMEPLPANDSGLLENFEDYHNYEELTAELQSLADEFPDLAEVTTLGQSVQGRELWMMKISDQVNLDEAEPKLLYIGNMHGDETAGRELLVYFIRDLLRGYGSDTRLTDLVDHNQIYIVPSMNPDGFERGRRSNARGVDLNRDFPDFTTDPNDTTEGRQPETVAIMNLHDQHDFVVALNFHGGTICFNMPWDTSSNRREEQRFGDDGWVRLSARQYADANDSMRRNDTATFDRGVTYGYEWYEVNGGLQDWASYYRDSIHSTIELSHTKYPPASDLQEFWQDNRESMLQYFEQGQVGISLEVTNPDSTPLEGVQVALSSSRRTLTFDGNKIFRTALPEEQEVTVSKPGYRSATFSLLPGAFRGTFENVTLEPLETEL